MQIGHFQIGELVSYRHTDVLGVVVGYHTGMSLDDNYILYHIFWADSGETTHEHPLELTKL